MGSDLWTYPETIGRLDLTGFDVEAQDGSIGKVDEATQDVGESYVVVDRDEEKVWIDRTKDEIENAPEFDKDNYESDEYRSSVGGYYGSRETADRETEEQGVADRS